MIFKKKDEEADCEESGMPIISGNDEIPGKFLTNHGRSPEVYHEISGLD